MGLIADVFKDEEFEAKAGEVLAQISNLPTKAIGLTKKAFNNSYNNTLSEQLDLEGIYQQDAAETEDFKEGVRAFLEKDNQSIKGNKINITICQCNNYQ